MRYGRDLAHGFVRTLMVVAVQPVSIHPREMMKAHNSRNMSSYLGGNKLALNGAKRSDAVHRSTSPRHA